MFNWLRETQTQKSNNEPTPEEGLEMMQNLINLVLLKVDYNKTNDVSQWSMIEILDFVNRMNKITGVQQ